MSDEKARKLLLRNYPELAHPRTYETIEDFVDDYSHDEGLSNKLASLSLVLMLFSFYPALAAAIYFITFAIGIVIGMAVFIAGIGAMLYSAKIDRRLHKDGWIIFPLYRAYKQLVGNTITIKKIDAAERGIGLATRHLGNTVDRIRKTINYEQGDFFRSREYNLLNRTNECLRKRIYPAISDKNKAEHVRDYLEGIIMGFINFDQGKLSRTLKDIYNDEKFEEKEVEIKGLRGYKDKVKECISSVWRGLGHLWSENLLFNAMVKFVVISSITVFFLWMGSILIGYELSPTLIGIVLAPISIIIVATSRRK